MPKKPPTPARTRDLNQLAVQIVRMATGEENESGDAHGRRCPQAGDGARREVVAGAWERDRPSGSQGAPEEVTPWVARACEGQ